MPLARIGARVAIRFDDRERTLTLSVRDLVEEGAPRGHLSLALAQTSRTRLAQGREVHIALQQERGEVDAAYRAEVRVQRQLAVEGWTVVVQGRVDGLTEEDGRLVIEEIKSTTLDGDRLYATTAADWPAYVAQLEVYLWLLDPVAGRDLPDPARFPASGLADRNPPDPTRFPASAGGVVGRLVLVSVLDGSRHVLGVGFDAARVREWVQERLTELVEARERRLAWLAERRAFEVPVPHGAWRPGQREICEAVHWGLDADHQVLVEAPTGLGKTAAALTGALRHALSHDKVVFWATSRSTQRPNLARTLACLAERGLPVRAVLLDAKSRVCLNDVLACRPDACSFADSYYDKLRQTGLVHALAPGINGPERLRAAAQRDRVCPFELGLDVSEHVDVIVGDYNYAFDPGVYLRRHFGDRARDVVVVVDEVHQLVDRARGYGSPRLDLELAERAVDGLRDAGELYAGFAELAEAIAEQVRALIASAPGPWRDGEAVIELPPDTWRDLAEQIDAVGLEYAVRSLQRPAFPPGPDDPWLDLARTLLRLHAVWSAAGPETVAVVDRRRARVGLLCLDPSSWIGPWIGRLGGFVGLSATLTPDFTRDLLGLDPERLDIARIPSTFPPENRRILVAPRVSTAYRDRAAHAEPTARLMQRCIEAIDGNVACYFPSFEMLRDLTARWTLTDRELVVQEPAMDETRRQEQLARLTADGPPVVLAAVLGGIFAEGVDLPPGALAGVLVAGPAFPPVGLERDLLREHYEERFGEGFRYASLVPGITRVVQAAGRLIRRPEDRGVIVLIGRRFRWRDVQALLPVDWDLVVSDDPVEDIHAFQGSAP